MSDNDTPQRSIVPGRTECVRASLTAGVLGALFGLVLGLLVGASTAALPSSGNTSSPDR